MFWPRVARFLFWLGGWSYDRGVPDVKKAVIIAAPHTSNWDGYWAFVYKVAIGLDVRFFFKDSSVMTRGTGPSAVLFTHLGPLEP